MQSDCDCGVIGLAVMGANLALNLASHGFRVCVWDRDAGLSKRFLSAPAALPFLQSRRIFVAQTVAELAFRVAQRPVRRVILLVRAGSPVDDVLASLCAALAPGDVVVDGGNSHFRDTERRVASAAARCGLRFVGCGVSGGELGARTGPALMPGGDSCAWPALRPLLEKIAARAPDDGRPCCAWMGGGGAGHYVKQSHNGIEYAEMQLLAETWSVLKHAACMDNSAAANVFRAWAQAPSSRLRGYLTEITADVLSHGNGATVDAILDCARQKGTGSWMVADALEQAASGANDVSVTVVAEAVFARALSMLKEERVAASRILAGPTTSLKPIIQEDAVAMAQGALVAARIVTYSQAFWQLAEAKRAHGESWASMDLAAIASVWRAGCIIRSCLLCEEIHAALASNPEFPLLENPLLLGTLTTAVPSLRRLVGEAMLRGIAVPCFASALAHIDSHPKANPAAHTAGQAML